MAETTVVFVAYDAQGNLKYFNAEQNGNTPAALSPHHVIELNGALLSTLNPLPVDINNAVTPTAGHAFEVATAGTAIIAIEANASGINGGRIVNAGTSTAFVDFVNTAGTVAPGVDGTTFPITQGATINLPTGITTPVTLNSTDDNHPFTVVQW